MNYQNFFAFMSGPTLGLASTFLVLLVIWSIVWKGLALWRAARRTDKTWFVILMIVNTAGILEIIYYFLIAKTEQK